jgi:TPP-dependent pyruvate/acetoin dehydrogenase alpha subunit
VYSGEDNTGTYMGRCNKRLETLHNEELHNLYSSLNITRAIDSRRMMCAGHVRMGKEICKQTEQAERKNPTGRYMRR